MAAQPSFNDIFQLVAYAKGTTSGGNTWTTIDARTQCNCTVAVTGIGAGTITIDSTAAGDCWIIATAYTANRYLTVVDTSATVKTFAALDGGAAAGEGVYSFAIFKRVSP